MHAGNLEPIASIEGVPKIILLPIEPAVLDPSKAAGPGTRNLGPKEY